MKSIKFRIALSILSLSVVGIANATTTTASVYGQSGPWISAVNPSFNWGTSVLNPTIIDSSTGLAMTPGDELTINYISGCAWGGVAWLL